MIAVTLRGLAQRRLRTILTAMAVVLGVAMVSASFTVSDTMKRGADSLTSSAYHGTDAVVSASNAVKRTDIEQEHPFVPASLVDRVRAVPGVQTATGDVLQEAKIVDRKGGIVGDGPFFGIGLDARMPGAVALTPFHLVGGRWAAGPGQVVIDEGTANKQHLAVGDPVRIAGRGPARVYRVSGVARFGSVKTIGHATVAIFDLATAQSVVGQPGRYDDVLVKAAPGVDPAALRSRLAGELGSGVHVQAASAQDRFTLKGLKQFIAIIRTVLLIFGIVAIVVGGATILNALSITVAQRSRELALLRTMGAGCRQLRRSVVAEAAIIGVGASVVGIAVGYFLAKGLTSVLASMGLDLPQSGTAFSAGTAMTAAAVGIGATLVAAIIPARRAMRVAPIEAMAEHGELGGGRVRRAFRSVASHLVSVLGRPAERIAGTAGFLARRNAMRMPGRTAATAAALTIGVTLVTAVATVGAALERVTTGEANRAIGTNLVLSDNQYGPVDAGTVQALAHAPGVRAIAPYRHGDARAFGKQVGVDGIDPAATAHVVRYRWSEGSQQTLAQLTPGGAVVTHGFATDHHLHVGSTFALQTSGGPMQEKVSGIVERGGINPLGLGDVTIAQPAFARAFPLRRVSIAFLDAPGASVAALQKRLSAYPGARVRTGAQFASHLAGGFAAILAIFDVLLALAVIVSVFGIVNTLVLSVLERTRELGLLRAAGMSRRQMRRMIRQESIITALVGAALGIGVGLALGALAISLLPVAGLGLAIPTGTLVIVVVVAVVLGVVAAAMPARRAARMDVLAAVSYA